MEVIKHHDQGRSWKCLFGLGFRGIEFIMQGKCGSQQAAWWQEEMLTGRILLPSKKQVEGTEVVCCLQTLQAHLQGHTSSNKAAPLNLPEQSTDWDQVFTHLSLQGCSQPSQDNKQYTAQ